MAALEKMPGHTRLYRRGATYYHRAAIPKDIADTYPKSEETFSLGTKDFREAKRLIKIAAVEVDRRFEQHRSKRSRPALTELTSEQLQTIHDAYYRHLLDEDEETRLAGFADEIEVETATSELQAALEARDASAYENNSIATPPILFSEPFDAALRNHNDMTAATRELYARGKNTFFASEAEEVLTWDGIDIDLAASSPSWPRLIRTLQEASLRASEAISKRFKGEVVETPKANPAPNSTEAIGPLLSELFEERRQEAQRIGKWANKLAHDYVLWTDLFIELQGDRPICNYSKADARAFKTTLLELPSNRNKRPETKGMSAKDAVAAAKAHDLPRLSVANVNKALGRLQATWRWADKQLDEEVADIFGPMKIEDSVKARDQADPFDMHQLQTLFASPLYTGCRDARFRAEPGTTDMSGTSWFWLPLLGLWTGARLNELCQLHVDDIDTEDGIPFLRLREGDETQRIKGGRPRIVPLHPELIKLGFMNYVNATRAAQHDRVFPTLRIDKLGYYSGQASKDFARYLAQLGLKTRKTSFHSFRHNFKDVCRHAGVPQDVVDILQGHALTGMAGRYGRGDMTLQGLHVAICKVEFPGIAFHRIRGYPQPRSIS